MNKKVIIGIIVVVVLIGGFMLSRGKSPLGGVSDSVASLSDLMARGTPAKCQYSATAGGGNQVSTVYYDGKKMYMENSSMVAGKQMMARILIDGTNQYIWSDDGTNQGIKMPMAQGAVTPSTNPLPNSGTQLNLGENLQMKCSPWSADESLFTPPSSVTFVDLSAMNKGFNY